MENLFFNYRTIEINLRKCKSENAGKHEKTFVIWVIKWMKEMQNILKTFIFFIFSVYVKNVSEWIENHLKWKCIEGHQPLKPHTTLLYLLPQVCCAILLISIF